ncbi:hypothetical protein M426DRAFT_76471 [Hypoxylon sp. CI-4A]|nr:hypothetical protein M426DRAFT_76471 [Hypoxylon sp. CI-4A]
MATQNHSKIDITVFRGWEDTGKYVWSPYVVKLEARLRFAGVRYVTSAGSLSEAPKGKIPYIEYRKSSSVPEKDSQSRQLLSDSALIAKTLAEWDVIPDLNAALEPSQRLHDLALTALLENKLDYSLWAILYPMRVVIGLLVHCKISAMLDGQGTGCFTPEEIKASRLEIWEGLNAQLVESRSNSKAGSDEPFWILGGDQPTEADTSLFGFVISALICFAGPDCQKEIRGFPALLDYAERIHNRYFPDYEKWPA